MHELGPMEIRAVIPIRSLRSLLQRCGRSRGLSDAAAPKSIAYGTATPHGSLDRKLWIDCRLRNGVCIGQIGAQHSKSRFLSRRLACTARVDGIRWESNFMLPYSQSDSHRLAMLREEVANARLKPRNSMMPRRQIMPRAEGDRKRCPSCGCSTDSTSFSRNSKSADGLQPLCKTCARVYNREWMRTSRGYVYVMLGNARRRSRQRLLSGRVQAGEHSLHAEDVFDCLLGQEGRCAYSGVIVTLSPHVDWQCSLERLDPQGGYTKQNSCLIAGEFQTRVQWSRKKVQSLLQLPPLVGDLYARGVCVYTLRKCLSKLVRHAKGTACRRRRQGREKAGIFSLDVSTLEQLFFAQRGLCYYSGMPMWVGTGIVDWQMSLERLDNNLGYVDDNVALICLEFQSSDRAVTAYDPSVVVGSCQWSSAKVGRLLDFISSTDVQQWFALHDVGNGRRHMSCIPQSFSSRFA